MQTAKTVLHLTSEYKIHKKVQEKTGDFFIPCITLCFFTS